MPDRQARGRIKRLKTVQKTALALGALVLWSCSGDRPPPPTPFERAILEGDVVYVDAHVAAQRARPAMTTDLIDGLEAAAQGCPRNSLEENLDIYGIFISAGADLNAVYFADVREEVQTTPLIRAAFYCPTEVVDLLIDAGANVNLATGTGFTPLMSAADAYYYNVDEKVELLLASGANAGAVDAEGRTALDYAFANTQVRNHPNVMLTLSGTGPARLTPRLMSERVE